jgi:hypothetical protein
LGCTGHSPSSLLGHGTILKTTTAQRRSTWRNPFWWNTLTCTEKVSLLHNIICFHTAYATVQSLEQFTWLHLALCFVMYTSVDHWRNTSDVMMRWKLRCADRANIQPLFLLYRN